jgi:hypothetical protein
MRALPFIILSATLLLGCKDESAGPITGIDRRPLLSERNMGNVVVSYPAFDVIRITNAAGSVLRSPDVVAVGIGSARTGYSQLGSFSSTYDAAFGTYVINFDFSVRIDSTLTRLPLVLRYYLAGGGYEDAVATASLFRYPYPSAEVLASGSIVPVPGIHIQDIAMRGNRLYFHPYAALGLYAYDIGSVGSTMLLPYSAGDHIAVDSIFVFCDAGARILRFNTLSNAVDRTFSPVPSGRIAGLDVFNGFLYVMTGSQWVNRYTLDGEPVDSLPFPRQTYYMTIADSIIYSVQAGDQTNPGAPDEIVRFDLRTRQFLANLAAPCRSLSGIKISNQQFYYCDWFRNIVGVVPVAALKEAGSSR